MGEMTIIRLWKKSENIGELAKTVDTIYCYTQLNLIEELEKVSERKDYDSYTLYRASVIKEGNRIIL